ncbi:hypothetical protein GCM10023149_10930 [Mucilaginibacter gynuensis]|uniref:Uncharacterized protein n=1 Tax=Mucilaginibacter gynuensis TaxID=1302236 RepID=A0ABP8G0B3_9SPHI
MKAIISTKTSKHSTGNWLNIITSNILNVRPQLNTGNSISTINNNGLPVITKGQTDFIKGKLMLAYLYAIEILYIIYR